MRLAFIDPVFTWPPAGGAPLDLYHCIIGLQRLGHEAALYYGDAPGNPAGPAVDATPLPFSCIPVQSENPKEHPSQTAARYREAVTAFQPDLVFLGFGFFLKPFIAQALADYPQIGRYYAYEPFCPRDFRQFKNGATCPKNYLFTPWACTACTLRSMRQGILSSNPNPYTREYLAARAFGPRYHRLLLKTVRNFDAIAVNNAYTKSLLRGLNPRVHVVGGGVSLADFPYQHPPLKKNGERVTLLMTGRASDPTKGLSVLLEACQELARKRSDFELWITDECPESSSYPWLKCLGWQAGNTLRELYAQADLCIFPSLWEEPFGLVALEAMAVGRPVVAADVGGLHDIVAHEVTGLRYPALDSRALASCLTRLLDDAGLRMRMGKAGRARVEAVYPWEQVIAQRYAPMIASVLESNKHDR